MCLKSVTKRLDNKSGYGWKVFCRTHMGDLIGAFYTLEYYQLKTWYTSSFRKCVVNPRNLVSENGDTYNVGFHIFLNKKDAMAYSKFLGKDSGYEVHKVQFKNAHTLGKQFLSSRAVDCIVVKDMRIIKPYFLSKIVKKIFSRFVKRSNLECVRMINRSP